MATNVTMTMDAVMAAFMATRMLDANAGGKFHGGQCKLKTEQFWGKHGIKLELTPPSTRATPPRPPEIN